MTLSADDKRALSGIRFEKAKAALDDARANLEQGRLNTSAARAQETLAAVDALRSRLAAEL